MASSTASSQPLRGGSRRSRPLQRRLAAFGEHALDETGGKRHLGFQAVEARVLVRFLYGVTVQQDLN